MHLQLILSRNLPINLLSTGMNKRWRHCRHFEFGNVTWSLVDQSDVFRRRTFFVFRKSFVFPASLAHARYSSRMIDKPKSGKIRGRCQPLLEEANRKTKTWPSRQANVEVYHQQPNKSCKLGLHLLVPVKEPKVS